MLSRNAPHAALFEPRERFSVGVNADTVHFITLHHSQEKLAGAASDIDYLGAGGEIEDGDDAVGFFGTKWAVKHANKSRGAFPGMERRVPVEGWEV